VVASDITKTMNARLRIAGSINRSAMVKRASALSSEVSAEPPRLRSIAARLCASARCHKLDSGIEVLIQRVVSAGSTPIRNM
jgi:hypothetical protein